MATTLPPAISLGNPDKKFENNKHDPYRIITRTAPLIDIATSYVVDILGYPPIHDANTLSGLNTSLNKNGVTTKGKGLKWFKVPQGKNMEEDNDSIALIVNSINQARRLAQGNIPAYHFYRELHKEELGTDAREITSIGGIERIISRYAGYIGKVTEDFRVLTDTGNQGQGKVWRLVPEVFERFRREESTL